jgi:benzoyl-CoA-dihydrodiol lyase
VAALNGVASGGGYELALACDQIVLCDDGNSSAVSFPETPLLAVLPGTGGLTRLVDKRKVRRDLADVFSTLAEGVRGKRAEGVGPRRQVDPEEQVRRDGAARAQGEARGREPDQRRGRHHAAALEVALRRRGRRCTADYSLRSCSDRSQGSASRGDLVLGARGRAPTTSEELRAQGATHWHLRAFRELDDVLLELRFNHPEIGLVLLRPRVTPRRCARTTRPS